MLELAASFSVGVITGLWLAYGPWRRQARSVPSATPGHSHRHLTGQEIRQANALGPEWERLHLITGAARSEFPGDTPGDQLARAVFTRKAWTRTRGMRS